MVWVESWRSNKVVLGAPNEIFLDPVSGVGTVDLNLDSRLGHGVPVMRAGERVEVWDSEAELVLVGTLKQR